MEDFWVGLLTAIFLSAVVLLAVVATVGFVTWAV